jgi:hypothetical protein
MSKNIFVCCLVSVGTIFLCISCKPSTSGNRQAEYDVLSKDTLYHSLFYIDTTDATCTVQYKHCPKAIISYPIFTTPDTTLNSFLNAFILKTVLYKTDTSSFSSVNQYLSTYFDDNKTIKQQGSYDDESAAWNRENSISYYAKIGRHITLKKYAEQYEGGAHPNAYIQYAVLDLIDKKQLNITDLLNTEDTALLRIGERYFRNDNSIDDTVSLADAGFFVFGEGEDFEDSPRYGKFHFTSNFALTKDGIEFVYNTYEIGPYAVGASSLTIPYNEIVQYLKLKIW